MTRNGYGTEAAGRRKRGGSAVEFALLTVVWVPLLLGTLSVGTTMIDHLQAVQVARDAGHMYARGVDFSFPANQSLLARVAQGLDLRPTGGEGRVILSTISYIGRYECKAMSLADNSEPPNPYPSCTNYGHFVFTHRLEMGDSAIPGSRFGDPQEGLVEGSTGYISRYDYTTHAGARATGFRLLPKPNEEGADGFQAGQFAYVVETRFRNSAFARPIAGDFTYTYAIF